MSTNLDLRGVKCPLTVLRFRQFVHKMKEGESVTVYFDDQSFNNDLAAYCRKSGYGYKKVDQQSYTVTKA